MDSWIDHESRGGGFSCGWLYKNVVRLLFCDTVLPASKVLFSESTRLHLRLKHALLRFHPSFFPVSLTTHPFSHDHDLFSHFHDLHPPFLCNSDSDSKPWTQIRTRNATARSARALISTDSLERNKRRKEWIESKKLRSIIRHKDLLTTATPFWKVMAHPTTSNHMTYRAHRWKKCTRQVCEIYYRRR